MRNHALQQPQRFPDAVARDAAADGKQFLDQVIDVESNLFAGLHVCRSPHHPAELGPKSENESSLPNVGLGPSTRNSSTWVANSP